MREQRRTMRRRNRSLLRIITIVLCLITLLVILWPNRTEAGEPLKVVTVQVEAGDSLWELADTYDNNNIDLRKYIYLIQEYNNMTDATIYPGQIIELPIYS